MSPKLIQQAAIDPHAARELEESRNCPACIEKRCHMEAEWKHHPCAGHGYTKEQGWTHEILGKTRAEIIRGE